MRMCMFLVARWWRGCVVPWWYSFLGHPLTARELQGVA